MSEAEEGTGSDVQCEDRPSFKCAISLVGPLTTTILVVINYFATDKLLFGRSQNNQWPWLQGMLYVLYAGIIIAVLFCHFSDPGKVKRGDFKPVVSERKPGATAEAIAPDGSRFGIFFCDECQLWRPALAQHCSSCGCCFRALDHHCGMMGTCVAENNMKFFMLVLLFVGMAGALTLIAGVKHFYDCPECSSVDVIGTVLILVLLFLPCGPPFSGSLCLSCIGCYSFALVGSQCCYPETQWKSRDSHRPWGVRAKPTSCLERVSCYFISNFCRVSCRKCRCRSHLWPWSPVETTSNRVKERVGADDEGGSAVDNQVDALFEASDRCMHRCSRGGKNRKVQQEVELII